MFRVDSLTGTRQGTWIEVRLSRLAHNLKVLKQSSSETPFTLAVVKANAYGHGLLEVARALAPEVTCLGVTSLQEALELREHEIHTPVCVFGRLSGSELELARLHNLTLSVSSFDEAREISETAQRGSLKTKIHVKVDTGMGRLGIPFREAGRTIEKMAELPGLNLEGIYTHFPSAEDDDGFAERQLKYFAELITALRNQGIHFRYRHAANSAGILKRSHPLLNMMRPGLMLYGVYPAGSLKNLARVLPILTLKSRILFLKHLADGESAGYGRAFIAKGPTRIAVLPVGYSHGYPYNAWPRAEVLYHGKRLKLAGRISMDYTTLCLGDIQARVQDEITLIGEDREAVITPEDLAEWAGTIPYEIVTRLLPSIPRFYK